MITRSESAKDQEDMLAIRVEEEPFNYDKFQLLVDKLDKNKEMLDNYFSMLQSMTNNPHQKTISYKLAEEGTDDNSATQSPEF